MNPAEVLPLSGVLAATFAGAWLTAEIGFRIGAYRRENFAQGATVGAGAMVGSLFALLAFMLAFTFGAAANRYDARRQLLVNEANAVSTAFLRADLLESPWAERMRDSLREYVDVRLDAVAAREATNVVVSRTEELHSLMWGLAIEATNHRPTPTNSLVLQSINDVIDLHTDRVAAAFYSHIPTTIWMALLLVAAAGMMAIGYQAGVSGPRPSLLAVLLMFAFSAVVMLIADLDSSQSGWLETNQEALEDVARVIRADR